LATSQPVASPPKLKTKIVYKDGVFSDSEKINCEKLRTTQMTPSRKTSIIRRGKITNIFDISHAIFIDITKIKTKENEINFDHLEEITRISYDTMTNKDDINGDFYNTPNDDEIQEISHRSRAQDVIDEVYSTIDEFILTISYIKFAIAGIVISSCIKTDLPEPERPTTQTL
jgi:hypothetical protein